MVQQECDTMELGRGRKIPWLMDASNNRIQFHVQFGSEPESFETFMTSLGFHTEKIELLEIITRHGGRAHFHKVTIKDDKLYCMCCGVELDRDGFLGNQGFCIKCASGECIDSIALQDFGNSAHGLYFGFGFSITRTP